MTLMSWQIQAIIARDILAERRREAISAGLATRARERAMRMRRRGRQDAHRRPRITAPARG